MTFKPPADYAGPTPERVAARLLANVTHVDDGCIVSNYSTGSHGYSQIGWVQGGETVMRLGHRVAWESVHGAIPTGMTIDHLCRNRRCINVEHLRLLSNVENATLNGNELKTECPKGHPYAGDNLYVNPKGHRLCRACARARFGRTAA